MARIRTIKPEFWEDEKLAKLPIHARLLFIGTWNFADDNGVLLANPVLMKSHIFPYEDIGISTISEWIDMLVENGMPDLLSIMPDRASLTHRTSRQIPSPPDTSCNTPSSSPGSCR